MVKNERSRDRNLRTHKRPLPDRGTFVSALVTKNGWVVFLMVRHSSETAFDPQARWAARCDDILASRRITDVLLFWTLRGYDGPKINIRKRPRPPGNGRQAEANPPQLCEGLNRRKDNPVTAVRIHLQNPPNIPQGKKPVWVVVGTTPLWLPTRPSHKCARR